MKNKIKLIIFLLLSSHSAFAQDFVDRDEFKQLKDSIKQQNYDNAWVIATQQEDDYLGDPDFDFLYGLAALGNEQFELAVFAFERVVANKPNWLDAQYYLAKSYLTMKDYQAVVKLCDALIAEPSLPNNLMLASKQLKETAKLRRQKQSLYFQQQISAALGYDSNINAGVKEDNIYLPFLNANVILDDASKENSDNYLSFTYALNGSKSLSQKSTVRFFTQINTHQFINETDFNRTSLTGSLSYVHKFNHFDASVGANVKPLWFAGEYYRTQTSVNSGLNKRFNQQWLMYGDIALGTTKNNINPNLDTNDLALSLTSQYLSGNWRHSAVLSYLDQESQSLETPHNSSRSSAFSINSLWIANNKWLLSSAITVKRQAYQDLHPFYFTERVDDLIMLNAMLQFKPAKAWSYQLNASFQDNSSNLSLFSYQRFDLGLTASFNF